MSALKAFLFEHLGHPLVFDENCESELAEWDEIEIGVSENEQRTEVHAIQFRNNRAREQFWRGWWSGRGPANP